MPGYRRYNRRSYKKQKCPVPMFGRLDRKAYKMAKKALRFLNVEFKHHDVKATIQAISDTPLIVELTNISQGDTDTTRVGAQIKLSQLNIKLDAIINSSASPTFLRVMLIKDKQTNQLPYAASDLLEDISISDSIVSPLNLHNKFRFRVLYDRVYTLSAAGGEPLRYFQINKILNDKIRYDASSGTIGDLTSTSYSLLLVSNQPVNTPAVTFFSRVRYVDN